MDTFGQIFLTTLWIFVLFAFLMVLFYIFSDIFRDHSMGGWAKAIWIVGIIIFPLIGCLVYLIARGKGMQERALAAQQQVQKQQEAYIKNVAGDTDPAEQIAKAKQLHDQGIISDEEFARLKAKALA
jgi:Short C-terminal domain/Phospholipase_D-nuclease N-terminal